MFNTLKEKKRLIFAFLVTFRLLDSDASNEIASFLIHCILFCARGRPETTEKECFAFACSHGETAETSIFHCHIFKCDSPETVSFAFICLYYFELFSLFSVKEINIFSAKPK